MKTTALEAIWGVIGQVAEQVTATRLFRAGCGKHVGLAWLTSFEVINKIAARRSHGRAMYVFRASRGKSAGLV